MIARVSGHQAMRIVRVAALVASMAAALSACDKVPLTAPTESTISLFASGASVPANGSVDIVASVIESSGTAVQNGTVVTFTTTLGTISPAEARTNNGKATVRLTGDGRSGTASVVAFSGGAKSDALELPVGAVAADNIAIAANPSTLPSGGGSSEVTAIVLDANGNAVGGVVVTFSTTAGSVSQGAVTTDASGRATTTLTTTATTTVTARVGGGTSGETSGSKSATVEVRVAAAPTVSVTSSPATPTVGEPVTFTITVTPSTNGAPIQSITIDYGDGNRQSLGASSTTASHIYEEDDTYTVKVTVRDTAGQESSQVLVIAVIPTPTPTP